MKTTILTGSFLAALAVAAPAGPAHAESADLGRQLTGHYCMNPMAMPKPGACISLSYDGHTAEGYTDSPNRVLNLRPGTYWLTLNDDSAFHNYSLARPDGSDLDITGVVDTPGSVTVKINLTPGSWTLFCEPHRMMGMHVDLHVGGVGHVG